MLAALLASATIMPMYGDNIKDNVTLPEMGTITGRITDADRQVVAVHAPRSLKDSEAGEAAEGDSKAEPEVVEKQKKKEEKDK